MTDPQKLEMQAQMWSASPRDWAELAAPALVPAHHAALELARVGRGSRVLDVGCGSGDALVLARLRGAEVAGIDAAPALVDVARERLPRSDLRVGDMEALPYKDGSFDAVLHLNTLIFAEDRARAVAEARRVLAPGGALVAGAWAEPERCELAPVLRGLADLLPERPPPGAGPFSLAAPGATAALLEGAGLRVEETEELTATLRYRDADTLVRTMFATGPVHGIARRVGREKVAETLVAAAAPFRRPDGSYRLRNVVRLVAAVR